jgi:hypothetical protein
MDDASDTGLGGRLDDRTWRLGVHPAIRRLRQSRLSVEGRDVENDLDALNGAQQVVAVSRSPTTVSIPANACRSACDG